MALILSVATPEDLPGIVKAQYSAFHPHDTLHRLIYPSPHPVPEEVITRTVARQLKTTEDPHVTWLKITDPTSNSIVAAAKWIIWPPSESPSAAQLEAEALGTEPGQEKRWPDKVDVTWILPAEKGLTSGAGSDDVEYVSWAVEEFYSRRRERVQGPAVLLDMCFCSPTHHRRGAGKQLVEWGCRKADELGVTAFVEASLLGRRLYESCGFVVTEDVKLEGGKVSDEWKDYGDNGVAEYKFMVREKRAANSPAISGVLMI